jgi:hypothetical protein
LAFRRRKAKAVQPDEAQVKYNSTFVWVKFQDKWPPLDSIIWIWGKECDWRPRLTEWDKRSSVGGTVYTHWMPAVLPEPPKEPDLDAAGFCEWIYSNAVKPDNPDNIREKPLMSTAWHAALKWERERKK